MKVFLFITMLFLGSNLLLGQTKDSTFLKKIKPALSEIIQLYMDNDEQDELYNFKNSGFLEVSLEEYYNNAVGEDLKYVFSVTTQFYTLEGKEEKIRLFPTAYIFIDEKLVFFKMPFDFLRNYKIEELIDVMNQNINLEKIGGDIPGYHEVFSLHGGFKLSILENWKYEIKKF